MTTNLIAHKIKIDVNSFLGIYVKTIVKLLVLVCLFFLSFLSPSFSQSTSSLSSEKSNSDFRFRSQVFALKADCEDSLTVRLPSRVLCAGEEFEMKVEYKSGSDVLWYANDTSLVRTTKSGDNIKLTLTETTTFYFMPDSADTSCTLNRTPFTVTINKKPATPEILSNARVCVDSVMNLEVFLSSGVDEVGNIFAFYTDVDRDSLALPPYLPGNYYAFQESLNGCISDPVMLTVSELPCDSLEFVNLKLSKTANIVQASLNQEVEYRIIISNSSTLAATNVSVVDSLPAGLEFVSSNFFISNNGVLTATIDTILANTNTILRYKVKAKQVGELTNYAEIKACDQLDLNSKPGNGIGNNEDDEDLFTITVSDDCNISAPVISTNRNYICPGETVILMASGCDYVVWSDGQEGQSIEVTPDESTVYSAYCKVDECESEASNELSISLSSDAKPLVVSTRETVCTGEEAVLTVYGCPDGVKWSNGETENQIVVSPTVETTYSAVCEGTACAGNISNSVTVKVSTARPEAPTADALINNECPIPYVNLNDAVISQPANTTLVFKNGVAVTSSEADSLIYFKGLYYIFAQSAEGCLSIPAPVVADVIKCSDYDINLASTLNVTEITQLSSDVKRVKFLAQFKNKGNVPVFKILVSDSLFSYFPSPVTYTISNVSTTGRLEADTTFNGTTGIALTGEDSFLQPGETASLRFTVDFSGVENKIYYNQLNTRAIIGEDTINVKSNWNTSFDVVATNPTEVDFSEATKETCIALGLTAISKVWQSDSSLNVKYQAVIANCGVEALSEIRLCDLLESGISDSAVVTLVEGPILNDASSLVLNASFDGQNNSCLLISENSVLYSGTSDTLTYTLNIVPNGDNIYSKSLEVFAYSGNTEDSDVSNDGLSFNQAGSTPTVVSLDPTFSYDRLGLAKELEKITKNDGNVFDIQFKFSVKNYSDKKIENIQITDDLEGVFGDSVEIQQITLVSSSEGWEFNEDYVGSGSQTKLLVDSTASLDAFETGTFSFYVRIKLNSLDKLKFENFGLVIGQQESTGLTLDDASSNGSNPDSDLNGDPKNDSTPTPIDLSSYYSSDDFVALGIAKSGKLQISTTGALRFTYTIIVKNFGEDTLTNIVLTDNLRSVFDSTQFAVLVAPSVNSGSLLIPNNSFNGVTVTNLLDSGSVLLPGKQDTLTFVASALNEGVDTREYKNQVQGSAVYGGVTVEDLSVTGKMPDLDEDGNPGNDFSYNVLTIADTSIVDTSEVMRIIISEGLSPNGDGINDEFTIQDESGSISLSEMGVLKVRIYNRAGNLVYKSEDYQSDMEAREGWDGKANTGEVISKGSYLPNGTYFYVVSSSDEAIFNGKRKIGYVTLNR